MLNRRFVPWLGGILLVLALGYGLLHLFALRFAQGDVYPPYSSLRSDPLGKKALYELGYELDNRPDWLRIPLSGLVELLDRR